MDEEDSKARGRRMFIRRNGVSMLVLLHFTALLINNLPHNAFTYKVDDLYLWYLNFTGQYQTGWGMYGTPTRLNDHFQLKVYNTDKPDEEYRFLEIESPRELYLVEAMAFSNDPTQTHLARAYLTYKERDLHLKPAERIELHRYSSTIVLQADNIEQPTTVWELQPEGKVSQKVEAVQKDQNKTNQKVEAGQKDQNKTGGAQE